MISLSVVLVYVVPEGTELPHALRENLRTVLNNAKMDLQTLTTDHRELHGTVSKVGKAIDRNFEPDYNATTRNDVFASERNTQLLNTIIAQHFYRQGMDEVANTLVQVTCWMFSPCWISSNATMNYACLVSGIEYSNGRYISGTIRQVT